VSSRRRTGALVGSTSIAIIRHALLPRLARGLAWLGLPLALGLGVSGFLAAPLVVFALPWLCAVAASFRVRPALSTAPVALVIAEFATEI
jgi:hypothetical protein